MLSAKDYSRLLTEKQLALLRYVTDFITTHCGMAPTVRDCAAYFKKRESTIYAHLAALQRKGFLRRTCQARSIALRDPAFTGALTCLPVFEKINVDHDFAGQVAQFHLLAVLPRSRKPCFAVKMPDDSLHDIGIYEEDLVVAEWCAIPEIGDLVVIGTSAEIHVEQFAGKDPYRTIFGVVLAIQRFYR